MSKKVKYLIPAVNVNMGGIIIKQAIPTQKVDQVDPFLLLHHGQFSFRDHSPAKHQGIGPHPHRGFSPVTFVIDGEIHHQDSRGNNQIAKKGEVQWMHAGAGIIHSERPSQQLVDKNGRQEIIQLWINSPAEKKMTPPKYQYYGEDKMTIIKSEDGSITSKLIAGTYHDFRSSIQTESELLILWATATSEGQTHYEIPNDFNAMIYVISGELKVDGYGLVEKQNLIVFDTSDSRINVSVPPPSDSNNETQFLVLAGAPINEKVVQQGPFVMNSETEILEAMRDYQMGKMGILIEEG